MAILNNSNAISTGGYDINNSLRFRSSASAYLSRTFATGGTSRQIQTCSLWVKRGTLGSTYSYMIGAYDGSSGFDAGIQFLSDALTVQVGGVSSTLTTTQVFRDPSAWYHIVVAIDTTQATAANRVKVYVNGNQVTAFSTATYPAQNSNINFLFANGNNRIGTNWNNNASTYYDGYMAETNFIDGQALTPSSFGETDATTGSWKPKAYTSTYGTNGFYLPFKMTNSTSSYAGSFNGSSQYLSSSTALFNYTTANAATQTATIEAMVYLNSYQTPSQVYYSPAIAAKGDVYMNLGVNGSGNLIFYHYDGTARTITGSSVIPLNTWTYVALTISGGTATIYVNGTSVGSGTWYGIQAAGQGSTSYFGRPATSGSALYLNGYISNLRVSSIARTISTPSTSYSNDANTNFLTLQSATVVDNSTNAYAITNTGTVTTSVAYPFYTTSVSADYGGNNNNWTANNIQVASSSATTYDSMTDVPTLTSATVANYAVLNPFLKYSGLSAPTNGNLTIAGNNANWRSILSSFAVSSGKWYCEINMTSVSTDALVGILNINTAADLNDLTTVDNRQIGRYSGGYSYQNNGNKVNNNTATAYGSTWTTGDVIGIALDMDAGTIVFYKNNTSQGTAYSSLSGLFAIGISTANGTFDPNFGQRPFSYTPPTGFVRLNTYNLPDSTIVKGNTVMDATLYTADTAGGKTITNSGSMQPDLVWIKNRDNAENHYLMDAVRGAGTNKYLQSNTTSAETSAAYGDALVTPVSNGFSITDSNYNAGEIYFNGRTYVAWQWKANGAGSSNTSGSITSTVSVNTTAGFSIVNYVGNNTSGATVGHGLGVAPSMIIVKNRDQATAGGDSQSWFVYHRSIGATGQVTLNTTGAVVTNAEYWNNTAPSATVFSLGNGNRTNFTGDDYIAYCWAEIAGFSKFGSYVANASSDGPFIYTGFRPKFVMIKVTNTTNVWLLIDATRNSYNVANLNLNANDSSAENTASTGAWLDFTSNGFKIRNGTDGAINTSSNNYIYMAFAENPFKNALAR